MKQISLLYHQWTNIELSKKKMGLNLTHNRKAYGYQISCSSIKSLSTKLIHRLKCFPIQTKAPFSSTYTKITTPVQSHSTPLLLQSTHYVEQLYWSMETQYSILPRWKPYFSLGLGESNSFVQLFILIMFEVPSIILLFILTRERLIKANVFGVTFIMPSFASTTTTRVTAAVRSAFCLITTTCYE